MLFTSPALAKLVLLRTISSSPPHYFPLYITYYIIY